LHLVCGIHFIQSNSESDLNKITLMTQGSQNRGPNGVNTSFGLLSNCKFTLGHNLLSILGDVVQPIENELHSLSYNGEIYNYLDLAKEYNIENTANDASVLFELLSKFGTEIIQELDGMFAFVWVDKKLDLTIIGRDYFGQKPLFYHSSETLFVASSEQKNLLNFIPKNINRETVRDILTFKSSSQSIYKHIKQVKAGTYICLDSNFNFSCTAFKPKSRNSDNLSKALKESIDMHCVGLLEPAVLLSGGLDSSIILTELVDLGHRPVAYTIETDRYEDKKEVYSASNLCKDLEIEHHIVKADKSLFDEFVNSIDHVVGDGAFYFQWLLARQIKDKHNFALCGNGADELFGGYRRHLAFSYYLKYKSIFLVLKQVTFLTSLFPNSSFSKFLKAIDKDQKTTFVNFTKSQLKINSATYHHSEYFDLAQVLLFDQNNYLPNDLLSISDQSSMAFGIEFRSPFLSNDVFSISRNLNVRDKIKNGGKNHLRNLYRNNPKLKHILNRKKQGFGIEFTQYWGLEGKASLLDSLKTIEYFLSTAEIQHIQNQINCYSPNLSNEYWTILILGKWLKNQI
jgi:asparagine synthase (glutamine-hydrolysing)